MSIINIQFQAYIPKSLGKPLIEYFEDDKRFSPEKMNNYNEFKSELLSQGGNKRWLPEPGNTFTDCYYTTDDADFHDHHSKHSNRLSIDASFQLEKIGLYSSLDKKNIFRDHSHKNSPGAGHQHSDESHRVKAYIYESFIDTGTAFLPNDNYIGVCNKILAKRSKEEPLEVDIRNTLSGTYFTKPNSRPQNETTIVKVSASAGYPFTPAAVTPNIDFELNIKLYLNLGAKNIQISVGGWHNDFPAYELLINNKVVYNYNPSVHGYIGPGIYNLGMAKTKFSKSTWNRVEDWQVKNILQSRKKRKINSFGW